MLKQGTAPLIRICTLAMLLTACQPQPQPEEVLPTEPAASEVQVESKHLEGELQELNLVLPKCEGNNCSELVVERLASNYAFIDAFMDEQILSLLAETLSDAPTVVKEQHNAKDAMAASEVEPASPKLQLEQRLIPYKDAFVSLDQELKALSAGHPINVTVKPKILTADAPVATVVLNSNSYLGGAHGATTQTYYNFDLEQQKQLRLEDLIAPNQNKALQEKAYNAFKQWVVAAELAQDIAEYEQAWQFNMTNNFYLDEQGLVLQYAEYEIGPYVVGLPRLVIPYTELHGILKSDYLPSELQKTTPSAASAVQPQV